MLILTSVVLSVLILALVVVIPGIIHQQHMRRSMMKANRYMSWKDAEKRLVDGKGLCIISSGHLWWTESDLIKDTAREIPPINRLELFHLIRSIVPKSYYVDCPRRYSDAECLGRDYPSIPVLVEPECHVFTYYDDD